MGAMEVKLGPCFVLHLGLSNGPCSVLHLGLFNGPSSWPIFILCIYDSSVDYFGFYLFLDY